MNYEQFKYDRILYKKIIALEKSQNLHSEEKEYKRGDIIFHLGSTFDKVGMLKSGVAKAICVTKSGRELSDGFYFVGDFVPSFLLFTEERTCPYDLVAKKDTLIHWYRRHEFVQLLEKEPEILATFYSYIAYRNVYDKFLLRCMNYKHVHERLAYWLIQAYEVANNNINIPYSQEILAENLFVTRSTLNSELKNFEKKGLIRLNKQIIEILDIEAIKDFT